MKARDNLSEPIAPSVGVVIERAEILQGCAVAELVLVLSLHDGGSLRAERAYRLEYIHHTFVLHTLQHR